MKHATIIKSFVSALLCTLMLCAAGARAAEDPDYGAPNTAMITQLTCGGLSDDLKETIMATEFTGGFKDCGIMCQACGLCSCVIGQFKAEDATLDYSLLIEHVSCEDNRYTLTAGGKNYDCEAPRFEYPALMAPGDLHYPDASTIGYDDKIYPVTRMKTYVLSTTDDYKDVIVYYRKVFDVREENDEDPGYYIRYLDGNQTYRQQVEVRKNENDEAIITITCTSPNDEEVD